MDLELMWRLDELRRLAADEFVVGEVVYDGGIPAFTVLPTPDMPTRFAALRARAAARGYLPLLRRRRGSVVVAFVPRPPAAARRRWWINVALFAATIGTTFLAGLFMATLEPSRWREGMGTAAAFSASILFILVTHEMGHKVVALRQGLDTSWPYFIPFLLPLWGGLQPGTLGAVIVTRTPAPDRNSLIDMAAAGPIAGFLATIPVLVIGILQSTVVQRGAIQGLEFADPLLVQWLVALLLHPPSDGIVLAHPVMIAGWFGLLVTALNLLPASMLDGGHIARSLFGHRGHRLALLVAVLVGLALRYWAMIALVLLLGRRNHPGPSDDVTPVSPGRIVVAVIVLAIFILSAVPLRLTVVQ